MNIDITALQSLPEVDAAPAGLRPPKCPGKTRVICVKPTCKVTVIVVGLENA
jgi:hypothetical protein